MTFSLYYYLLLFKILQINVLKLQYFYSAKDLVFISQRPN